MKKTIGILGGMGPEATVYFYSLIIKHTKAEKDQEHIPVIIYSNPRVPPRTDAILKKGENPLPFLIKGARVLKEAGANFIVMPCITAHYFLPKILDRENIPFINLLFESLAWTMKNIPNLKKAGLLSSTGTLKSRLFHEIFEREGIKIIEPETKEQKEVMEAIFGKWGIKAGHTIGPPREKLISIANALISRGAEGIIAGCTEIPLALKENDLSVPLIDPLRIAALKSIIEAGYEIR